MRRRFAGRVPLGSGGSRSARCSGSNVTYVPYQRLETGNQVLNDGRALRTPANDKLKHVPRKGRTPAASEACLPVTTPHMGVPCYAESGCLLGSVKPVFCLGYPTSCWPPRLLRRPTGRAASCGSNTSSTSPATEGAGSGIGAGGFSGGCLWLEIYEKLDSAHPRIILRDTFRQCATRRCAWWFSSTSCAWN
jgi:hypothetical protein